MYKKNKIYRNSWRLLNTENNVYRWIIYCCLGEFFKVKKKKFWVLWNNAFSIFLHCSFIQYSFDRLSFGFACALRSLCFIFFFIYFICSLFFSNKSRTHKNPEIQIHLRNKKEQKNSSCCNLLYNSGYKIHFSKIFFFLQCAAIFKKFLVNVCVAWFDIYEVKARKIVWKIKSWVSFVSI